jgi:hypothetical protein
MTFTRKPRIPSVPYLEQKIAEICAIAKPTNNEIVLLAQYRKLLDQRINIQQNTGQLQTAYLFS